MILFQKDVAKLTESDAKYLIECSESNPPAKFHFSSSNVAWRRDEVLSRTEHAERISNIRDDFAKLYEYLTQARKA